MFGSAPAYPLVCRLLTWQPYRLPLTDGMKVRA
jgi:hypothetical protein